MYVYICIYTLVSAETLCQHAFKLKGTEIREYIRVAVVIIQH